MERFHPGVADNAEASGILNAYLNIADQHARREQFDEALRLCRLGIDYTVTANRKDYVPDFLWISGDVHRRRGDLEPALKDLDESVRLSGPADGRDEVWRPVNFALSLICRGDLLGEENAISMGRRAEALSSLERAFRIGDDLAHRDPNDQMSRSRVANAGISMAGILRNSDPSRALEVYDHTFRHVAEIKNNSSFRRFEVTVLAGSSYALRKLGRAGEARRRLDGAFERLAQLKLYPAEQVRLGSETEDSLRALGEYEAGAANFPKAVATLKELLRLVQAGKSRPETSLTDAVRMSTIYRTAASIERRAGLAEEASVLEKRDGELWRQWSLAFPGNPFVRGHLEAAQVE
jgi:tetratricopeptide (TPR) repeat protein